MRPWLAMYHRSEHICWCFGRDDGPRVKPRVKWKNVLSSDNPRKVILATEWRRRKHDRSNKERALMSDDTCTQNTTTIEIELNCGHFVRTPRMCRRYLGMDWFAAYMLDYDCAICFRRKSYKNLGCSACKVQFMAGADDRPSRFTNSAKRIPRLSPYALRVRILGFW